MRSCVGWPCRRSGRGPWLCWWRTCAPPLRGQPASPRASLRDLLGVAVCGNRRTPEETSEEAVVGIVREFGHSLTHVFGEIRAEARGDAAADLGVGVEPHHRHADVD